MSLGLIRFRSRHLSVRLPRDLDHGQIRATAVTSLYLSEHGLVPARRGAVLLYGREQFSACAFDCILYLPFWRVLRSGNWSNTQYLLLGIIPTLSS